MTIDEAIALVNIEKECINRADNCNRKCNECNLVQDTNKLLDLYKQLAEWLEELKAIKEMDLSIPQHFTKEQSDWIKAYCIQRNKQFYNKAIDDFVNACKKDTLFQIFGLNENGIERRIAEQLKTGGREDY